MALRRDTERHDRERHDRPHRAPSPPVADLLRRLSLHDERTVSRVLGAVPISAPTLDARTEALVRLAGLVASGAPTPSYRVAVERARAARVSDDEIVSVLVAIGPALGAARLVAAVPALALAIDYDIEEDRD